jgi:hypothetical protein
LTSSSVPADRDTSGSVLRTTEGELGMQSASSPLNTITSTPFGVGASESSSEQRLMTF